MTDRRSIQADAARSSRAFQFVPGHVGGRVASAQPVRRRRTIGIAGATPPEPPTSAVVSFVKANGALTTSLPSIPAGTTTAVAFLCSVGSSNLLSVPTGWRTLINASSGSTISLHTRLNYAVIALDAVSGEESLAISFAPADGGKHEYVRGAACYFTGGGGGSWAADVGTILSGTPGKCWFKSPAGSPWVQFGALRDAYLAVDDGVPYGTEADLGPAGCYVHPGRGTYEGSAFTNRFVQPSPYDEDDYVAWEDGYARMIGVPLAAWWNG